LNVSNFNTSNVTSMYSMFNYCSGLTTLDVSTFNTSAVTAMDYMFSCCSKLTKIFTSSSFSTDSVTSSSSMFQQCNNLTGGAGTTYDYNVKDKTFARFDHGTIRPGYFTNKTCANAGHSYNADSKVCTVCGIGEALTAADFISLLGSDVTEITADSSTPGITKSENGTSVNIYGVSLSDEFKNETGYYLPDSITSADLSGLDLSGASNLEYMFSKSSSLTALSLNVFGFIKLLGTDVTKITADSSKYGITKSGTTVNVYGVSIIGEFREATEYKFPTTLSSADLKGLNTSGVTSMSYMFSGCYKLTTLDVSSFNTSTVTSMSHMFNQCTNLTTLDVSKFDISKVTDMRAMFYVCSKLDTLDVTNFKTEKVTDMSYMFGACDKITSLNVSNFDTSSVSDMTAMFYRCINLTNLDISNFDTSKVSRMTNMFLNCTSLVTIYASSNFSTKKVTDFDDDMFKDCTKLTGGNGTTYDSSYIDKTYARIDTAETPGYFTAK